MYVILNRGVNHGEGPHDCWEHPCSRKDCSRCV